MQIAFMILLFDIWVLVNALSSDKVFRPTQQEILNPDETPLRSVYGIKSIQTDYWNTDDGLYICYIL